MSVCQVGATFVVVTGVLMVEGNCALGYVDSVSNEAGGWTVRGWGLAKVGDVFKMPSRIVVTHETRCVAQGVCTVDRKDVLDAYGIAFEELLPCGFGISLLLGEDCSDPLNNICVYVQDEEGELHPIHGPRGMISGLDYRKFDLLEDQEYIAIDKLNGLAISPTSRCNLRCGYCYIKSSEYVPVDMERQLLSSLSEGVDGLGVKEVHLGIMGEPTIDKDFFSLSSALLEKGVNLSVATNLAAQYSDEQIDILSRFHTVEVSIDTLDRQNLKLVRTCDVRVVSHNLLRLLSSAVLSGNPLRITFSIVLNELTALDLPKLVAAGISAGVSQYQLLDMRPSWRGADFSALPPRLCAAERTEEVRKALETSIELIKQSGASCSIDSAVTAIINGEDTSAGVRKNTEEKSSRLCIAPWSRLYVNADGNCTPCFHYSTVGILTSENTLTDVVNNSRLKRIRSELLSGNLTAGCQDCLRAEPCRPEETRELVKRYFEGGWKKAETFGQPVDFSWSDV